MEYLIGTSIVLFLLAKRKKRDVVLLQPEPDHGRDLIDPIPANEAFANMNFQVINNGQQVQDNGQNFQPVNSEPIEGTFNAGVHNVNWNWNQIFNQNQN